MPLIASCLGAMLTGFDEVKRDIGVICDKSIDKLSYAFLVRESHLIFDGVKLFD